MTYTIRYSAARAARQMSCWGLWRGDEPKALGAWHTEQEARAAAPAGAQIVVVP